MKLDVAALNILSQNSVKSIVHLRLSIEFKLSSILWGGAEYVCQFTNVATFNISSQNSVKSNYNLATDSRLCTLSWQQPEFASQVHLKLSKEAARLPARQCNVMIVVMTYVRYSCG